MKIPDNCLAIETKNFFESGRECGRALKLVPIVKETETEITILYNLATVSERAIVINKEKGEVDFGWWKIIINPARSFRGNWKNESLREWLAHGVRYWEKCPMTPGYNPLDSGKEETH